MKGRKIIAIRSRKPDKPGRLGFQYIWEIFSYRNGVFSKLNQSLTIKLCEAYGSVKVRIFNDRSNISQTIFLQMHRRSLRTFVVGKSAVIIRNLQRAKVI